MARFLIVCLVTALALQLVDASPMKEKREEQLPSTKHPSTPQKLQDQAPEACCGPAEANRENEALKQGDVFVVFRGGR